MFTKDTIFPIMIVIVFIFAFAYLAYQLFVSHEKNKELSEEIVSLKNTIESKNFTINQLKKNKKNERSDHETDYCKGKAIEVFDNKITEKPKNLSKQSPKKLVETTTPKIDKKTKMVSNIIKNMAEQNVVVSKPISLEKEQIDVFNDDETIDTASFIKDIINPSDLKKISPKRSISSKKSEQSISESIKSLSKSESIKSSKSVSTKSSKSVSTKSSKSVSTKSSKSESEMSISIVDNDFENDDLPEYVFENEDEEDEEDENDAEEDEEDTEEEDEEDNEEDDDDEDDVDNLNFDSSEEEKEVKEEKPVQSKKNKKVEEYREKLVSRSLNELKQIAKNFDIKLSVKGKPLNKESIIESILSTM